jgi:tetratricopeptide (TPR) repeat protein
MAPLRAQSGTQVQQVATARATNASAQSRLAAGEYREAQAMFDQVIAWWGQRPAGDEAKKLVSDAFFGKATAVHQSRRSSDIDPTEGSQDLRLALAGYDSAQALDSARFAGAANNNAGLLLRDAGRHREALARFLAASRTNHPARATFLVQAATEYAAVGEPDSAAATYRAALKADSTLASAREGLLTTFVRRPTADSIINLATRWSANPRHASQVTDAMYAMLETPGVTPKVADSCLVLLAMNFVSMGLGPPDVAQLHAARLRGIATATPSTAPGVEALLKAYATKPSDPRPLNAQASQARWWTDNYGRRTTWSAVLRSIGSWYDARDDDANAIAYYEAATSRPWAYNEAPPWMDLDAIAPLAQLYAQSMRTRDDSTRLDRFIEGIFGGKMVAYNTGDYPRIRRFHTGLGAFYASRGQWANGARGAVFQLEHMRDATRRLNASRPNVEPLRDSPDLLAQLVIGYCRTNQAAKAATLAAEVNAEYVRLKRPENRIATSCGR